MQCINDACNSTDDTRIVETRKTPAVTYRVHRCATCQQRYTTIEVLAPNQSIPYSIRLPKDIT